MASPDIPSFPNTIWLYLTLAMHPPLSLPSIRIPRRLRISFTPLGVMEWLPFLISHHFWTRYDSIWLLQCILLCLFHRFTSLIDSGFLMNLWNLWNDGPSWYFPLSETWCDSIWLLQCILLCLFYRLTSLIDSGYLSNLRDLGNDGSPWYIALSKHRMTVSHCFNASSSVSCIY